METILMEEPRSRRQPMHRHQIERHASLLQVIMGAVVTVWCFGQSIEATGTIWRVGWAGFGVLALAMTVDEARVVRRRRRRAAPLRGTALDAMEPNGRAHPRADTAALLAYTALAASAAHGATTPWLSSLSVILGLFFAVALARAVMVQIRARRNVLTTRLQSADPKG